MERPRTGHRHHNEGSIAVVELIRRESAAPIRIPSAEETETNEFLTELLGPDAAEGSRPKGALGKAAKLVGLAVGSLVLCGSVAAAATLARNRPPAPQPSVAAPTPIVGLGALLPDTLEARLSGHPGGTSVAPTTTAAAIAAGSNARSGPTARTGETNFGPAAPATSESPTITVPHSPAAVVREFYRLVGSQPAEAAQLIAPSLLATDLTGFVNAWQSAAQVELENVQANPDGTVQAVIRMIQPDGSWLRLVELLHVTQGNQPQISGAELLSAQNG